MNLSSCRELKNNLLRKAYALPGETRHLRSYPLPRAGRAAAKRRGVETSETTSIAALGVAPAGKKDFRLAVRIFKGQEHRESQLLEGLSRQAKGEMDVAEACGTSLELASPSVPAVHAVTTRSRQARLEALSKTRAATI